MVEEELLGSDPASSSLLLPAAAAAAAAAAGAAGVAGIPPNGVELAMASAADLPAARASSSSEPCPAAAGPSGRSIWVSSS